MDTSPIWCVWPCITSHGPKGRLNTHEFIGGLERKAGTRIRRSIFARRHAFQTFELITHLHIHDRMPRLSVPNPSKASTPGYPSAGQGVDSRGALVQTGFCSPLMS